jgi:hypothetical protein
MSNLYNLGIRYVNNGLIVVTTYIEKSLLTSLCQREELSPLWKRGVWGDFLINVHSILRPLINQFKEFFRKEAL